MTDNRKEREQAEAVKTSQHATQHEEKHPPKGDHSHPSREPQPPTPPAHAGED